MSAFPRFAAFVLKAKEDDTSTFNNNVETIDWPAERMVKRFAELKAISHANVASYVDISETFLARDFVIVVTEHFGTTLESLMDKEPLSDNFKEQIFLQIAAGMEYLLMNNISHGFLETKTIYIDKNSSGAEVKLSCYGLPFLTNRGKDAEPTVDFGTFLAPELLRQKSNNHLDSTPQADVWSLGIIILQIYHNLNLKYSVYNEDYWSVVTTNDKSKSTLYHDLLRIIDPPARPATRISWVEALLNGCLQVDQWKRLTMAEAIRIIRGNILPYSRMNNLIREKAPALRTDSYKMDPMWCFRMWSMCGSRPEKILLKRRFIKSFETCRFSKKILQELTYGELASFSQEDEYISEAKLGLAPLPYHNLLESSKNWTETLDPNTDVVSLFSLLDIGRVGGIDQLYPLLLVLEQALSGKSRQWAESLDISEDIISKYNKPEMFAWLNNKSFVSSQGQYHESEVSPINGTSDRLELMTRLKKVCRRWLQITDVGAREEWRSIQTLATPFLLADLEDPNQALACFEEFLDQYFHGLFEKNNSDVVYEYVAIFFQALSFVDPRVYKMLSIFKGDGKFFQQFLLFFVDCLPFEDSVRFIDECQNHSSSFPLLFTMAMVTRFRAELRSATSREAKVLIRSQPDLWIEEIIQTASIYERMIPPSCLFRAHASPWKEKYADELHRLPMTMSGLSLTELARLHCPRLSSEEFIWRLERSKVFAIDTRTEFEFNSENLAGSHNHPANHVADIEWLRCVPDIVNSEHPKCIVYGKNDRLAAEQLAEAYVMKGVPFVCLLHVPYGLLDKPEDMIIKN